MNKFKLNEMKTNIGLLESEIQSEMNKGNRIDKYWMEVSSNRVKEIASEDKLFWIGDSENPLNSIISEKHRIIPDFFISNTIKTKLTGNFYVNNVGTVYYESNEPIIAYNKIPKGEKSEVETVNDFMMYFTDDGKLHVKKFHRTKDGKLYKEDFYKTKSQQ